jgi:hypothetical protein
MEAGSRFVTTTTEECVTTRARTGWLGPAEPRVPKRLFAARVIDSLLNTVSTASPGREPSDQRS